MKAKSRPHQPGDMVWAWIGSGLGQLRPALVMSCTKRFVKVLVNDPGKTVYMRRIPQDEALPDDDGMLDKQRMIRYLQRNVARYGSLSPRIPKFLAKQQG